MCTFFVVCYQRSRSFQYKQAKSTIASNQASGWSDDDDDDREGNSNEKKDMRSDSITYHDVHFPLSPVEKPTIDDKKENEAASALSAEMYQQRQRLFDEIAKRKKARKNLNRKSIVSNPNRNSVLAIHPLDLSQDPEVYAPPPMPTTETGEEEASWNRYKEDEEAIERQKRLDALSTERMEYEMYRSDEASSIALSNVHKFDQDQHGFVQSSYRKESQSDQWSQAYAHRPVSILKQTNEKDEQQQEDHENQKLMNPESRELVE